MRTEGNTMPLTGSCGFASMLPTDGQANRRMLMGELKISHRVVSGVSVGGVEGRLDLQGAAALEAYAKPS